LAAEASVSDLIPVGLRVDGLREPLGLGSRAPRLSWRIESSQVGVRQAAYQIQVSIEGEAQSLWDSGRVASGDSIDITYEGPPLVSRTRYLWRVRVWSSAGAGSPWSESATWETGLLEREDWTARWISAPDPDTVPDVDGVYQTSAAPLLRTEFTLDETPVRGRIYATALGLYELWVNGTRVGDQVLTPGWTDYHRRIQYQTYDVTGLLVAGRNALGVVLGDGWYRGHIATLGRHFYGDRLAALVQLEEVGSSGDAVTVTSDATWRAASSGIVAHDILMGEAEETAAWPRGWDLPGFDDSGWTSALFEAPTGGELVAPVDAGATVVETLSPVQVTWHDGRSIVDFGQNLAGHVRLDLDLAATTKVTLRHAELLDPEGGLYTENLNTAKQTDTYLAGPGPQRFEPRFTYHGFRYVEVSGLPEPLELGCIVSRVVSANLEPTGGFECSDPMLDQLQRNILRGQRSNFVSIPTDCPQRDERLGWTADAFVFAPTATFNQNVLPFFRKWLIDLEDVQRPSGGYPDVAPGAIYGGVGNAGWGDAGILLPWCLYVRYGVTDILERHYDGMRRHLDYLQAGSTGLIRSAGRYGDWVGLEGPTPKGVIGTAFFADCARTLGRIASVLGDGPFRDECEELYDRIRTAFIDNFVADDGAIAGRTQVGHVLALAMDLVPDDLRAGTAGLLAADIEARGGHLATGFLGTPFVLPVLSDHGYHDLACRVAQQRTFPSWGFQIEHGATSMWERWDGLLPDGRPHPSSMNSFNHYAFGSVGDWLYRYVGGLDPDSRHPGYRHARIRPRPGGTLRWARLWHDSPYGRWEVEWQLDDGHLTLAVTVPPNTTADVILPGETLADLGTSTRVESGRHRFCSAWSNPVG
jgi:alpha-L-rhamnosidase